MRSSATPRTVGSYELLERLARGGTGDVWRARHVTLSRSAAVKLLVRDVELGPWEEQQATVRRFVLEAQLTASLRSPHVAEVHDLGTVDDDAVYFAMEFLEGMNAEQFVYRFGPLEPGRVIRWLEQACHALGELHARRFVHCDVKPANLFVSRRGHDVEIIKVLDFGLATAAMTAAEAGAPAQGARPGTPGYMAPEQVLGSPIDARTDVYALGCVGYWLLAGQPPFEADEDDDLMQQQVHGTPPPLPRRHDGAHPQRLEALIMACLSKDPRERPADADVLSSRLSEALAGAPWTERDARAWWDQHRNEP